MNWFLLWYKIVLVILVILRQSFIIKYNCKANFLIQNQLYEAELNHYKGFLNSNPARSLSVFNAPDIIYRPLYKKTTKIFNHDTVVETQK